MFGSLHGQLVKSFDIRNILNNLGASGTEEHEIGPHRLAETHPARSTVKEWHTCDSFWWLSDPVCTLFFRLEVQQSTNKLYCVINIKF